MIQIMKFVVTMISILLLVYIIPIQSRWDSPVYLAGSTVYRGVLVCNETVSGEVIYNGPDSPQAYESWILPVKDCKVIISTCFDGVGDPIAFDIVIAGRWTATAFGRPGNCPDGEPGEDNQVWETGIDLDAAPCDGSIDRLVVIRVSTVSDTGSGNYTLRLECDPTDSDLCPTVCSVDPELDILQQIEDEKNNDPQASVNCTLCDAQCEEMEDDPQDMEDTDSSDSSSDDSFDAAQSELEKVDEHEIWYEVKEDEGTDNDHDKTYLLKVAQSVWINLYSFLAVVTLSCALLFICIIKRKK